MAWEAQAALTAGSEGRARPRRHDDSDRPRLRSPTLRTVLGTLALVVLAAACTDQTPNMLDPRGPGARRIEGLWWLMLWVSAAVFAIVLGLLAYSMLRSRRQTNPRASVRWGGPFIAIGGVAIPFLILAAVFLVSLRDMRVLSSPPTKPNTVIRIVGHQWWWEAVYPGGAATANELHIPVGEPVQLELTTDDVIHSFWVPQLQAKTDLVNDRTNFMWLQADEPGRYRGQCAEFCGLQHANHAFFVVAEPPEEFRRWLATESQEAAEPSTASEQRGREVFLTSTCVGCHAIRGTTADAQVGPDLTHVASRRTLAGGTISNTRDNLERWILDPQSIKPGVTMPPSQISGEDLEALLDYLTSLD